ncbi:MAG: thioredoxin family protein [Bacilli bacterium]|nr:thioredoxin family protein [Clostridia bacterium]MBR4672723.1 thioredoxin family protein [Bacilli bacterium]
MKIIKVGAMWCPACIKMNKFWKSIKESYSNIEFTELDLDMDEDEVKKLNIGSILPEIIVYNNDQEISRIIGEKTQEQLEKELGELIDKEC